MTASVEIDGRKIIVNGDIFHMKGINWNPIPIGVNHEFKT